MAKKVIAAKEDVKVDGVRLVNTGIGKRQVRVLVDGVLVDAQVKPGESFLTSADEAKRLMVLRDFVDATTVAPELADLSGLRAKVVELTAENATLKTAVEELTAENEQLKLGDK